MSKSLNNFCENLVNSSNPRYIGSQPTIDQQVSWQVKKEEEARQAIFDNTISKMHEAQTKRDFTPMSSYTPSYTPSFSSSTYTPTYPSFNCTNFGRVI